MKLKVYLWCGLILMLAFASCEKYNHIDNGSTVKVPYTLFIGGYHGTLHQTNDGLFYSTLFYTDNSIVRQVLVADTNICLLKRNFYCSKDDSKYFAPSNTGCILPIDSFKSYYFPNNAIYDFTDTNVYLVTRITGLEFSSDKGKTFTPVTNYAVGTTPPGPTDTVTSVTQMTNGDCFAMVDSQRYYKKTVGGAWTEVLADGTNDLPFNRPTARWYVAHAHDTLIAIDFNGRYGVYYSTNLGTDWFACTGSGMPKTRKILFGNQAFGDDHFYVGYDSGGLFRMEAPATFTKVNTGIPWYAKIGYVEGKNITYRTNITKNILYCSTDLGLYWSKNGGRDWEIVHQGKYSTLK